MGQNRNFRKLWIANSVSSFGTQITILALPLTAVILLHATPAQMGILTAYGTFPFLVVGLPAGVWVDRFRRRPILIMADIGRALLLGLIPLLAVLDRLQITHLYLVAFLTGILSLFYDITEETYLPTIVKREQLVESNSKLAAIDTTAELTAPVIAGGLVQILSGPIAIALDSISYFWSAFWLSRIHQQETSRSNLERGNFWKEIREGLAYLLHNPLLRPSLFTGIQWQFFGGMNDALLILYLSASLHLPPTAIGLMYAVGSLSALVSSNFSNKATRKFGPGPITIVAALLLGLGWLAIPLAIGTSWTAFAMIAVGMLIVGAGNMTWNVTTTAITQSLTPDRLLGRITASGRFLTGGALPLGALMGGWLAGQWGLRPVLLLSCSGLFLGALWVCFSPLRTLRRFPDQMTTDRITLGVNQELNESN